MSSMPSLRRMKPPCLNWRAGASGIRRSSQPNPPDGIWIDIAGSSLSSSGARKSSIDDLVGRLTRQGSGAGAALPMRPAPPGPWRATAGRPSCRPAGSIAAVAGLPVAGLRLPQATVEALAPAWESSASGNWPRMPRAPLVRRFGKEVGIRLDQALGHAFEPLNPLVPRRQPSRRVAFAEPIGRLDDLKRVVEAIWPTVSASDLERAGSRRAPPRSHFRAHRSAAMRRCGSAPPGRRADARHLAKLFDERLQTVDPGFGIEAALLVASKSEPLSARQVEAQDLQERGRQPTWI